MNAIDIQVDEKSCVGCSLCVDECPTKVFEMGKDDSVPKVANPKECFGCLSCLEICPATAIAHANVHLSESYYHDPRALELVSKLGGQERTFNVPCDKDHIQRAMGDLGIRLLSVTSVLKQTLGQSLPSVGTTAGMSLASQLPRYQQPRTIGDALKLASTIFSPAWDMKMEQGNDSLTVTVSNCFVRDVCTRGSIELGGDICKLFSNYFTGMLGKICPQRPRLMNVAPSPKACVYTLKLYENKS
jgi:NAD-dependent dihydropyrimidine dehydrogenase PreA subunit